jgi:hypothetical protein
MITHKEKRNYLGIAMRPFDLWRSVLMCTSEDKKEEEQYHWWWKKVTCTKCLELR